MAADELEARRRQRWSAVRASASHVRVVLPYTDGDVGKALSDLEEVLLAANVPNDAPADDSGPGVEPAVLNAVGRLASDVASVERAAPSVQPVAPDGRFELVPLYWVSVGRDDLARIGGAAELVVKAVRQGDGGDELLGAVDGHDGDIDEFALTLDRLAGLLGLAGDPAVDTDVDVLAGLAGTAGEGATSGLAEAAEPGERRVVLTAPQFAAYQRLAERVMHAWHRGDPLGRFLFSGSPDVSAEVILGPATPDAGTVVADPDQGR